MVTPDQWQVIYGNGADKWLVLSGGFGYVPPDQVDDLSLLGETTEVIRKVMTFRIRAASVSGNSKSTLDIADYAKRTLAGELGITPERLISYADDMETPYLYARGWQQLAKAYFFLRGDHANSASTRS